MTRTSEYLREARAVRAGTYEGQPVWHGRVAIGVNPKWRCVRNAAGCPIAYASKAAAFEAARRELLADMQG